MDVSQVEAGFPRFVQLTRDGQTSPQDTPWGRREMSLVDPDGNRLRFATHPND